MLVQIYGYRQKYRLAEYIGIGWTHIGLTLISKTIKVVFHLKKLPRTVLIVMIPGGVVVGFLPIIIPPQQKLFYIVLVCWLGCGNYNFDSHRHSKSHLQASKIPLITHTLLRSASALLASCQSKSCTIVVAPCLMQGKWMPSKEPCISFSLFALYFDAYRMSFIQH